MSESHAPRGRGSARGGRGGHNFRGGRGGARVAKAANQDNVVSPSFEDEGEIGQLKKKYSSSLPMIKELFPDWTDEDLVFALEDADGDLETAIERISEGNVSQWGEVKKKHADRPRTKPKEAQPPATEAAAPSSRGGRARGGFDGRGRARGDRGRGGRGGRAAAHVNGARPDKPATQGPELPVTAPVPPDSWTVDGTAKEAADKATQDATKSTTEQPQKPSLIPEGTKKGWASLFAKPTPPAQKNPPPPAPTAPISENVPEPVPQEQPSVQQPPQPDGTQLEEPARITEPAAPEAQIPKTTAIEPSEEAAKPPQDQVQIEPQPTTAVDAGVSTIDDQQPQQQPPLQEHPLRPAVPYTPTAPYKTTPGRSHFQRRILDQQEAVVMPGNHAVDRAAVQFGSMGLNGSAEDADVDEQREEPETRPQPPQHSPIAPRASLPPSTRAPIPGETAAPAPRAAPGLPPVPPTTAADTSFNDFNRYGEAQKPYDPFGQQVEQPHPQSQEPFSNQATLPSQPTVTTGADYSAFYGADQTRNPYYYGGYGQPQEVGTQRTASGFGATGTEAQAQPPSTQAPGRYGHVEATNSGQNTPNPTLPSQAQPTQPTHMPQAQGHGAFNYGYPYYSNPHYPNTYIGQMGQQHQYGRNRPMYDDVRRYEEHYLPHSNQFGYGSQYAPYGKGGMYGQPQHAFSYEHSSSPANAGAFAQGVPARDSGYGRTGSAQPAEGQQSTGSNAFGGIPDVFGRTQFGQNQPVASQQPVSSEEPSKGFESSKTGGPSPSVSHANRPGSAANNVPNQPAASQTGLPPVPAQQGSQQAFGGYPHLNPQYGGLGGLGTHHQTGASQTHHQGGGYGSYGAGFGTNYYGNTGRGGGWGGNYGH
ncbi:hypothetical protein CPC735_006280 [Coccidioides posadasii C735 delta SOWgp]|uniref:RNA polymerase II degradation factor 1 n=2 Tax=Coccidioides posadasii TaxID=199306 RepID=E9CZ13_COCPS|nr:hypothetical protein CPC735_006280 [Coccidioides posadasii C735 delta SOWgp]EER26456.1 hypothetical protein CPC735_006280 [Coccidioides posadasii C735 delta SOWgp]EFW20457.1 rnapii degradation factor def1 [Coccidioides posadasii str. Silveira]|eukprot:XP_003068601.1 hypothetical protein CPC735_006280 [Coccidioides posadasii C735 delta SOWgp]